MFIHDIFSWKKVFLKTSSTLDGWRQSNCVSTEDGVTLRQFLDMFQCLLVYETYENIDDEVFFFLIFP